MSQLTDFPVGTPGCSVLRTGKLIRPWRLHQLVYYESPGLRARVALEAAQRFEQASGLTFRDKTLLQRALTHRSYLNETRYLLQADNERLEFLGDAVLDFIVGEYLYHRFPEMREGMLTNLRATLVREETLAEFALRFRPGPPLADGPRRGRERRPRPPRHPLRRLRGAGGRAVPRPGPGRGQSIGLFPGRASSARVRGHRRLQGRQEPLAGVEPEHVSRHAPLSHRRGQRP